MATKLDSGCARNKVAFDLSELPPMLPSISPVPVVAVIDASLKCYREARAGITRFAAESSHWRLAFCDPGEDYRELIGRLGARGLILGPLHAEDAERAKVAIEMAGPAAGVCGGHRRIGLDLPQVDCDDYEVGVMGAQHFLDKGYRHFAFVDVVDRFWANERCRGFAETVARAGRSTDVFRQAWTSVSIPQDVAADDPALRFDDWLATRPKPLALMLCNDMRASEALQTCHDRGMPVPDEVAILGVDDDDDFCIALARPPLSSVAIPWEKMGYLAAGILDRQVSGEAVAPDVIRVRPTGVVERGSTGAIGVDDPDVRRAVDYIRRNAHLPIGVGDVVAAVGSVTRRFLERKPSAPRP